MLWGSELIDELCEILSDKQRELVIGHHLIGWSLKEIVDLAISRKTVSALKSELHRIRARVRAATSFRSIKAQIDPPKPNCD